jgi:XTP/dITP diphosphohydrolase
MKLLLGTSNAGKVREISSFLKNLPVEVVSLKDFKDIQPAVESGKSFLANARSKAQTYNRQTRLLTLAEDSGLQVDFLDGLPGSLSARFAGEGATDKENVQKLLREMRKAKKGRRSARFVCVAAVTDGRRMWIATGKCEGRIASRPIGNSGFGYDPVFIPNGFPTTFARLGENIKNQISHRARALQKVRHILETLLSDLSGKV